MSENPSGMSMILVQLVPGGAALPYAIEALRQAVQSGAVYAMAAASADNGGTWYPAWQVAGFAAPPVVSPPELGFVIPVNVNGWAMLAGYMAIIFFLFVGMPCGVGAFFIAAPTSHASWREFVVFALIALTIGAAPQALIGYLGHRAIRRDPSWSGIGRVYFAYVTSALVILMFLVAAVRFAFR